MSAHDETRRREARGESQLVIEGLEHSDTPYDSASPREAKSRADDDLLARRMHEGHVERPFLSNPPKIEGAEGRIRGNINLPPDIPGNPEAVFDVVQLPTGEIIDVKLRKSSGVRAYDEAVQRAILKSSPLPKPVPADLFQRSLELRFRPLDQ